MITHIKRTIHFYALEFSFLEDFEPDDPDKYRLVFLALTKLGKSRAKIRYQQFGEKAIFIQGIKIDPLEKLILGKLRCIRKDLLPELMNTVTDESRGIDAAEEEGLLETTHFVIDYSKAGKPTLALEYNQYGAKISDLVLYLRNIGRHKKMLDEVGFAPIVKDQLAQIKERINRCSEFKVKIHKDNLPEIKAMDGGIYSALNASIEHFQSDFATIILKYDYQQKPETKSINNSVFNLIRNLISKPEKTALFNILSIKAEDSEKGNLLETFDLLVDKVKSVVKVEKKKRFRTIVSADMFDKIKAELMRINKK